MNKKKNIRKWSSAWSKTTSVCLVWFTKSEITFHRLSINLSYVWCVLFVLQQRNWKLLVKMHMCPRIFPGKTNSTSKFLIHERDKHDQQTDIQSKFLNHDEAPKSEACEVHISTPSVFFKQINENKYINKSEAG